jgi:uncharacterized membrane protein YhhN
VILIIWIPIVGSKDPTLYKAVILGGLIFSLLGDIFLMIPGDRFLAGLLSFLVAHLLYILGFLIDQGRLILWAALPIIALAVIAGWILKSGMGKMKTPTFFYIAAISAMLWLAWSRWLTGDQTAELLAFSGAGLFAISDWLLAVNRFKQEYAVARGLNLFTYFAGQWLIALSVIGPSKLGF